MTSLSRIVAAHPLVREEPYSRIKFSGINQHGKPVYKVGSGKTEFGARQALRTAFRRFGGRCFHCNRSIEITEFTLDHLRPKFHGGDDHLHNLVFACRSCNQSKASNDLVNFEAKRASAFLAALDEHLVRCLKALGSK
jgi:5-methylcytosine-specific restriction endonuclease McrA